jgi:hypothetical protein
VVKHPGVYLVSASMFLAATSSFPVGILIIYKNGVSFLQQAHNPMATVQLPFAIVATPIVLGRGDYIEAYVNCSTTATIRGGPRRDTSLNLVRIA